MQAFNLPTLFDETGLTEDDHIFLYQKEVRIKGIVVQSALEVGRELAEVRDRLRNKGSGFEGWAQARLGYSRTQVYNFIQIFERLYSVQNSGHLEVAFDTQLQLAKAPDPQAAVDEALLRRQIEGELTAKTAKQIADYQRDTQIARDNMRSAQDRAAAVDRQLAYVKQQLTTAQAAAQLPKVVEKIVEKEVVPLTIKDQINRLQQRQQQLIRERDNYRQQLHEERSTSQARMLEDLEGENAERIRVQFADATRDYVNSIRIALNRLPSLSDTQAFEADDWQRLDEAIERTMHMAQELQKLKYRTSNNGQSFIVDAVRG